MRIDWEGELDERLVQRMQRGEGLAFAALTTRYWSLVHRICSNLLPSNAEAREATEATVLAVCRAPDSLASDASFRTSLLKVALREALARRRSAAAQGEGSPEGLLPRFDGEGRLAWDGSDGSAIAGMAFSSHDLRERIRRVLLELHELDHASFALHEVEGIPAGEAAAILGISAQSVRQGTHRASLMLTGYLASPIRAPACA